MAEEVAYTEWLKIVAQRLECDEIPIADVKECLYLFNELLYLNYYPQSYIDAKRAKELQVKSKQLTQDLRLTDDGKLDEPVTPKEEIKKKIKPNSEENQVPAATILADEFSYE